MINKIEIFLTKRKIKRYKEEIELLDIYDRYRDRCDTCKFFSKKDYWDYGHYTKIKCLIDFKRVLYDEDRDICQFYKLHKKFKKITKER